MIETFDEKNLQGLYDLVAENDEDLKLIIKEYSYPPLWVRPNTFETLVLTILEQQVSLASAYSAYKKLKERIRITPEKLLQLSDEELRLCYLSRQKITYTRELANAIINKRISLQKFEMLADDLVRKELKTLKGIGDWTVDIYLLHALRRKDIFPMGDLALVNSIKMVKQLPSANREDLLKLSKRWKPYRSIATMLLWHTILKKRGLPKSPRWRDFGPHRSRFITDIKILIVCKAFGLAAFFEHDNTDCPDSYREISTD